MNKWKCSSVNVPPTCPPGTVLLHESPFAMMIPKPWSLFASWSSQLYYLLYMMAVNQRQMSHHSASLLLKEILPDDLDLWPTTLTYDPSLAKAKVNIHTKNQGHRSNVSTVRVLTDTQTHGSDSMTSTPDLGGNNHLWFILQCSYPCVVLYVLLRDL